MKPLEIKGSKLTIQDVIDVANHYRQVQFSEDTSKKIRNDRKKLIDQITDEKTRHIPIYGVNTGCGDLKDVQISPRSEVQKEDFEDFQVRYIKAHNCGTGKPLPENIVRAIMLIRLNSFAKGMSGMKLDTCQFLLDLLNASITPWVLEEGSVGASGDLVPLAMIGATMIQLPEAKFYIEEKNEEGKKTHRLKTFKDIKDSDVLPDVFKKYKTFKLGAKEAMGLTNGANFMAGIAIIASQKVNKIIKNGSIATALSLEAIRGEQRAFQTLINEKSDRHEGQLIIAQQIRSLIEGSKRTTKKAQEYADFVEKNKQPKVKHKERVQDRYSFRCTPQIHGATVEALKKLESVLETEINSATDNPLFDFDENRKDENGNKILSFASGGNFHGQPLAAPIDYLKLALTSLGLNSDKRTFSLLDENLSYGLPADLAVEEKGKNTEGNTGYMIAQYAGAARAAENRVLSTPASVMSVATAANQEDFVSMGSIGALHLLRIIYNVEILLAIELLCATRALQLTYHKLPEDLKTLGNGSTKVYEHLKNLLGEYTEDNYIRTEIEAVLEVVKSGELVEMTGIRNHRQM